MRIMGFSEKDENVVRAFKRSQDIKKTYYSSIFAAVNLPMRTPATNYWKRTSGRHTIIVESGWEAGKKTKLPAGIIPRRLLVFLSHEWKKLSQEQKKARKIYLGASMADFMRKIGTDASGMNYRTITDQANRLFRCRIAVEVASDYGRREYDTVFSRERFIWWDDVNPQQPSLMPSYIVLSEDIAELLDNSMPVPVETLKKIGGSCMTFDIYMWLAYRHYTIAKDTLVTWKQLKGQFGSEIKTIRDFKIKFRKAFERVEQIEPIGSITTPDGVLLRKSPTPINPHRESHSKAKANRRELSQQKSLFD